jgi:hypothetical protein
MDVYWNNLARDKGRMAVVNTLINPKLRKSLEIYEIVQGLTALPEGLCSMQLVCGAVQFGRQVPPKH